MNLTALARTVVVDRLSVLENAAAHAHAVAAVVEHLAWRERQEADRLQAVLSSVKVFIALLPEGTKLELRAPKPASVSPTELLGVRPRLPVPPPDRELPPCPARTISALRSSATPPANREMTPTTISAAGPAPG